MKVLRNILEYKYTFYIMFIIVLLFSLLRIYLLQGKNKYAINEDNFVLRVVDVKHKNNLYTVEFLGKEKLIGYYKDFEYDIGDIIIVKGSLNEISKNTIPNLFNYQNYYKSKSIYHELIIEKMHLKSKNRNLFNEMKKWFRNRINTIDNNYLYAFILGDASYLDNQTRNMLQLNGLQHLLSIGSFEVLAIIIILNKMKKKYHIMENKYLFILGIIFFLYLMLVNFKIGVLRSCLCYLVKQILKYRKIKIRYCSIILIVLTVLLLIYPNYLYNIGFYYSFIISFGLSFIKKTKNSFFNILKYSFFANVFSFPINIYFNYDINIISILLSVLFLPAINFLFFPLSILNFIIPSLSIIFQFIITIFENLLQFFSKITLFHFIFRKPSIILIVLYYVLIIMSFRYKKGILALLIVIIIHANINSFIKEKIVAFLDVGQGDSIIVKNNNAITLIDTGGSVYSNYDMSIKTYLHSLGIKGINNLVISHGDYDHMGEAINLVENFKVEKVIFNCGEYNELEKELIKVLDKKKIKYYSCIKELNIDNSKLYFLQTKKYDNENDNSNVIYTELDGYKFMFMGDASSTTEKEILNKYNLPNIDVLKVGHHGSKTSSSIEFINKVKPTYSIISVGNKNKFGHPNKEVLDVLKKSKIYRTDQDGSIMFKIKNNKLKIETCSP